MTLSELSRLTSRDVGEGFGDVATLRSAEVCIRLWFVSALTFTDGVCQRNSQWVSRPLFCFCPPCSYPFPFPFIVVFLFPLLPLTEAVMSADSFGAGGSDAQQSLQSFWPRVMEEIRNLTVVRFTPVHTHTNLRRYTTKKIRTHPHPLTL